MNTIFYGGNTMTADELVLFVTTLAISIAKDKTDEDLELLAAILNQLSDTLGTIVTKRSADE